MKLSLRLQTIADLIKNNSIVADVGSDHGKLMIALFESGKINHGYAIENKKGPYNRLVKALQEEKIVEFIVPLFSDGIDDLPSNVDTIVIAGMGGNAIIEILKRHPSKLRNVSTIIVDAHSCLPKIRQEISGLGYVIANEKIIKEEEIYYEIIKFIKADIAYYNDKDLEFGPILREQKSAIFKEKYNSRIKEINNLINSKVLPNSRLIELENEKKRISEIL